MSETRTVHDPFLGKDVQVSDSLVDRLRGRYAQGPTMPNGEPEFGWRQFPTPPIQVAAADEIERLWDLLNERTPDLAQAPTGAGSTPKELLERAEKYININAPDGRGSSLLVMELADALCALCSVSSTHGEGGR